MGQWGNGAMEILRFFDWIYDLRFTIYDWIEALADLGNGAMGEWSNGDSSILRLDLRFTIYDLRLD